MNEWNPGNLQGLIPFLGGIYGLLMVNGTFPRNPRNPERMAFWRQKHGPKMKILCPVIIFFGVLQLLGVF